jgi:8-amino-7-oxononanoate synthase
MSALHRLRISLSAAHTIEDVDALLVALKECGILPATGSHAGSCQRAEQDVVFLAKL